MNSPLELTQNLIRLPSVTPNDAGCLDLIAELLKKAGFSIEHLIFGEVKNLWAKRGTDQPLLIFAGHTDVVPPGPVNNWFSPPFEPTIRDGYLYGRGAADMKGNLAAMVVACLQFIEQYPNHSGSIGFLLTSDEEGPAINGTQKVVEYLQQRGEQFTWCIVGEPSSENQAGDTIKIGRRGSLNGRLIIHGKQGHIAYPHLAMNPIHRALAALTALMEESWDVGKVNEFFPATSLQFSNIHAGVGVTNVIPGQLEVLFNFRYSPVTSSDILKNRVEELLKQHHLSYDLEWKLTGMPFITEKGRLLDAACAAIEAVTKKQPILSTSGGTSDGRFIAPTGCEVIELGVCNATIHQANECVGVEDLVLITQIYYIAINKLLNLGNNDNNSDTWGVSNNI
jgi:succinyl-diaminopimelate desuccinylase